MKELGGNLPENGAAVVFLIRKVSVDKVLPQIKHKGTVIQSSLSDDAETRLEDALANAGS